MARARRSPTSPAKKRPRAVVEERSEVHDGGSPAKATASPRKRARAGAADRPLVRAPRSTERSALAEPVVRARAHPSKTRETPPAVAPRAHPAMGAPAARRAGRAAPARLRAQKSPLAISVGVLDPAEDVHDPARGARDDAEVSGRVMELHWGDDTPSSRRPEGLVQRWIKRGDALLRHLAEHGAARHEYRADLREGRFVWIDAEGRVSAEARAQVLCSWSRTTSALTMAWADPLVRAAGVARFDGVPAERDDIDEEAAWRVAMEAADRSRAEYLYRVPTPHAWYFFALSSLTFHPGRSTFRPSTPVGLVLRGLAETRRAVESRAEPAEVVRERLSGLGQALLLEAEYAYRSTDWVARLERAGRRLVSLAEQLPRASFTSVAAGLDAGEWLDREATIDLSAAIELLEDEWVLFA